MLDESRHFTGKDGVKRLLDAMELLKLNIFHWHLTDGTGWRLEIKKYPKLTTIGATGNHTDPKATPTFYTQDDIREILAYATERGITIIPEIDMPGHASAANRAYPEFSGGGSAKFPDFTFNPASTATENYLHDILAEVRQLFPHAPMIHLGGDEVHFGWEQWPKLPEVKQLMQDKKFTKLDEVEGYFVRRIADHLHDSWNKIGLWDEASRFDLPPEKTVLFWWRHDKPQGLQDAVTKGYSIVLCPRLPLYFDFVQDASHQSGRRWAGKFAELSSVYAFPESLGATLPPHAKILGIQANLWTETTVTQERRDFMTFPRLLAASEAAWTKPERKDYPHFQQSMAVFMPHLEALGIKPWLGGPEVKK
jgi:hexosaminidase